MWPWHNHGLSSLPALCARLCTGSVIALAGCAAIRAGPPRNDRRPRKPKRARSQDDRQIVRPSAARSLRRYAVPPRLSSTSPLHEFLLTPYGLVGLMSTSLIIARSATVRVATTACATSSAPRARLGAGRTRSRLSMNGVDTEPGQMATTRRPRLRTSSIRLLEKPSTACFDAQYAVHRSTRCWASKHAVLGCTVRRAPLDAVLPRERGDVHDGAGARVQHGLEERPRDEVERADVHPHRRVPVLERELHEGPEPPDPGVVPEHLRHAPLPVHPRGERLHAGGIGHVARHADAVDALRLQVAYCGVYIGFGARADSDSRPLPPQCLCRGAPDSLGCAGHDGERGGKIHRGTNIRHPCPGGAGTPRGSHLGWGDLNHECSPRV